ERQIHSGRGGGRRGCCNGGRFGSLGRPLRLAQLRFVDAQWDLAVWSGALVVDRAFQRLGVLAGEQGPSLGLLARLHPLIAGERQIPSGRGGGRRECCNGGRFGSLGRPLLLAQLRFEDAQDDLAVLVGARVV